MGRRGFSMLEMLIVIAILGILGSMGASYLIAAKPHADLERAETELVARLNQARMTAINREVQTRMRFDTTANPDQYWVEQYNTATSQWVDAGLPLFELPESVTLYANTFASSRVTFNTRGGLVSGGSLTLKSSKGETAVFSGNLANGRFQYGAGNTR
jgi:prepilin-type N-terminal cleavage/methylation domain-containing protein